MDLIKDYIFPKRFSIVAYVCVILHFHCGVILTAITTALRLGEMEKFSCAVDTNYATYKTYVEKTCFSNYDDHYNSPIRFYAFVVLSFGSVTVVNVVYSLAVASRIDETENAEKQSSGSDESQTGTKKSDIQQGRKTIYVFYFYLIHLLLRSMLGILFTILQRTVLYPAGFDSKFSCIYPDVPQADYNNVTTVNFTSNLSNVTCTTSSAQDKQFWGRIVLIGNLIFAFFALAEVIYLIKYQFPCFNTQSNVAWSCDSQFITEYFFRKPYVPDNVEFTGVDNCTASSSEIYKQNVLKASLTPDINYGQCKSLDDMFIDVVIHTGRAVFNFPKHMERHEIYDVYMKLPKKSVCLKDIKDLFCPLPMDTESTFPKKNLALGRPGIGKTVLSRKIMYDWAKGNIEFYQDKIAFFFKFRCFNFKELQNVTLKKFLKLGTELNEDQFESVFEEICRSPQEALLIFDGLDECGCDIRKFQELQDKSKLISTDLSSSMSAMILFIKIMCGQMLPGATVLVTSRPTANDIFCKLKFDRTVEIIGFTSDKIQNYVHKFCINNDKVDIEEKIWGHIKSSSELKNLCYIPVNCFIVCVSLSQCLDDSKEHLPTTLTELYEAALKYFRKHHHQSQDRECYEKVLRKLQQLAFYGMENDKLVFSDLVDDEMKKSGLLNCLSDLIFEIQTQVCFIHLTVQEFLAAKHIIETKEPEDIKEFISLHVKDGKWHLVLQFLAGLLGRKMKMCKQYRSCALFFSTLFDDYKGRGICRLGLHNILLMKCLRETEDENIAQETAANSSLKHVSWIEPGISNPLSPSDWVAVGFVSKHLHNLTDLHLSDLPTVQCSQAATRLLKERCIQKVTLIFCNLGDLSLVHLMNALMESECHVDHQHSKLTELTLTGNNYTDSGVFHLTEFLKNNGGRCMESLSLKNSRISPCGISNLCEILFSDICNQLTVLDLSFNPVADSGVAVLCETLIEKQSKLNRLFLYHCSLTSECIPWIVKVLIDEHCDIIDLSLGYNVIRNEGVRKLCCALLTKNCSLAKMNLSICLLTHECTIALLEALGSGHCGLTNLHLSGNEIGDEGVAMLCCAVRKNQCKLTELSISGCALTDKCIPSLCGALGDVRCSLTKLDVGRNDFSDKHLLLSDALRSQHCCLKFLKISCEIAKEKAKRLFCDVEESEHCKARGLKIAAE